MPGIAELAACELALVAGGEDCVDPNPPETVEEMIARLMQPVSVLDIQPIN